MTWLRIDDGLPEHIKTERLFEITGGGYAFAAARLVWLDCACASARALTDGRVTLAGAQRAVRLPPRVVERAIGHLVEAGFFVLAAPKVWVFHDWAEYQPTRAEVQESRKSAAQRQRDSRQKCSMSQRDMQRDSTRDFAVSHASPSRPVPNPRERRTENTVYFPPSPHDPGAEGEECDDSKREGPEKAPSSLASGQEVTPTGQRPSGQSAALLGPSTALEGVVTVDDVDDVLPKGSNGRVEVRTQAQQKLAFVRALQALGVTRGELEAAARLCRDPSKLWPTYKDMASPSAVVTIPFLLGAIVPGGDYEAKHLQTLLARARRVHAVPSALPEAEAPSKGPYVPPMTREESVALMRAKRPAVFGPWKS